MIDSLWAKNLSLAKLSGQRAGQDGSSSRKALLICRQQAEETLAGESDWHFSLSTISIFKNSDRWCVITYLHSSFFVILHSVLRVLWIINKLFIDDDITYQNVPAAQTVKNLPAMQETRVRSLGWEVPLKKGMAIHSSILAWRIPWTEKPGRLQSLGLQRVRHNWVTNTVPFLTSLPPLPPPIPLGYHRAPDWASCAAQQLLTTYPTYTW